MKAKSSGFWGVYRLAFSKLRAVGGTLSVAVGVLEGRGVELEVGVGVCGSV
jgi:hypothetical protein